MLTTAKTSFVKQISVVLANFVFVFGHFLKAISMKSDKKSIYTQQFNLPARGSSLSAQLMDELRLV